MKKSNLLIISWGLLSVLLAAASCNKDNPAPEGGDDQGKASLKVTPSTPVEFSAADTKTVTLTVETDAESWSYEKPNWVNATKEGNTLEISATMNDLGTDRSGTLVFSADKAEDVTITITQKKLADDEELPAIWEENLILQGTDAQTSEKSYYGDEDANAAKLVDGNLNTYYGPARSSQNTTAENPEWAIVRLKQKQPVNQIWLYPRGTDTWTFPTAFNLYLSTDGTNWGSPVVSETGYKTSSAPQKFEFDQTSAEWVKLEITSMVPHENIWLAMVGEMEVYLSNTPIHPPFEVKYDYNLAIDTDGAMAEGSTSWQEGDYWAYHEPKNLIYYGDNEGLVNEFWAVSTKVNGRESTITNQNQADWLQIKLSQKQQINEIRLLPYQDGFFPLDFTISISVDGEDWGNPVVSETGYAATTDAQVFTFPAVEAQYVRVDITKHPEVESGQFSSRLSRIQVFLRR